MSLILKALADPQRYAILQALATAERQAEVVNSVALLASVTVSQSTLSHHMKELRSAGLVAEKRTGRVVSYHLNRELLEVFFRHMQGALLGIS